MEENSNIHSQKSMSNHYNKQVSISRSNIEGSSLPKEILVKPNILSIFLSSSLSNNQVFFLKNACHKMIHNWLMASMLLQVLMMFSTNTHYLYHLYFTGITELNVHKQNVFKAKNQMLTSLTFITYIIDAS